MPEKKQKKIMPDIENNSYCMYFFIPQLVQIDFYPFFSISQELTRLTHRCLCCKKLNTCEMMKYMLLSPFDNALLTNVFDDIEAVADCLAAIAIALQPEGRGKETT